MANETASNIFPFRSDIPTGELKEKLINSSDLDNFIQASDNQLNIVSFKTYINWLCAKKDIVPARVIERACIDPPYGHQLFNGTRKNPSRDKVIQLAFGFELNPEETQYLLKVARKSELYVKVKRDAVIYYALAKNLSVDDLNVTLASLSLPVLERSDV
jgi:hypothetical protein